MDKLVNQTDLNMTDSNYVINGTGFIFDDNQTEIACNGTLESCVGLFVNLTNLTQNATTNESSILNQTLTQNATTNDSSESNQTLGQSEETEEGDDLGDETKDQNTTNSSSIFPNNHYDRLDDLTIETN